MTERTVKLGLFGYGTVGSGVVQLLQRNHQATTTKLGCPLHLARVASRSLNTHNPPAELRDACVSTDPWTVVHDPEVEIVIELIGGIEPARDLILQALQNGKDVVTANKALLALHGDELFAAAEANGARLGFEASVAGGIPIIRTLRESLAADRNCALFGIVNGTCNYILSTMAEQGDEFDTVLRAAQEQGLAEADPSFDIDGIDAAHKLTLLAMLAFGVRVPFSSVYTEGIRYLSQTDILFAKEFGYTIKLLAIAKSQEGSIDIRVHPTMIPSGSLLADVGGAYNAIFVQGEALGASLSFGLGAGSLPTATAVMADVIDIARTRASDVRTPLPPLGLPWSDLQHTPIRAITDLVSEYYLRVMVVDQPGVLAKIAGILGDHGMSIASVIQRGRGADDETIPLVMRTHTASEHDLRTALDLVDQLSIVQGKTVSIRIEDNLQ